MTTITMVTYTPCPASMALLAHSTGRTLFPAFCITGQYKWIKPHGIEMEMWILMYV